jgi:hypothetical protein
LAGLAHTSMDTRKTSRQTTLDNSYPGQPAQVFSTCKLKWQTEMANWNSKLE